MRHLFAALFLAGLAFPVVLAQEATAPPGPLEGTWEIISLIDNGQLVDPQTIRDKFASDSKLVIGKNTVTVNHPGRVQQIVYVLDTGGPGNIDLAGVEKLGSKGIYALNGDILTLCFGAPDSNQRPASFTSGVGGQRLLVVCHRVTPAAAPKPMGTPGQETIIGPDGKITTVPSGSTIVVLQPTSSSVPAQPTPPAPVVAPVTPVIATIPTTPPPITREQLLGTWGHQDNEQIDTITFNPDNTFSSTVTWKPGFLRTFRQPEKRSGTWQLIDRTVTLKITASTDPKHETNQIQSMRIDRINEYEMIYFDQTGKSKIEWKVR